MYEDVVKELRNLLRSYKATDNGNCHQAKILASAADAIEKLSAKVGGLQFYVDSISKLPDCNTCMKKSMCEFIPRYGEYCRINCPAWLGEPEPPKEEA